MEQYKGAIMNEIYDMISKYPKYSMGEILHSFTRKPMLEGNRLVEATDEQIYNAIEKAKTLEYESEFFNQ